MSEIKNENIEAENKQKNDNYNINDAIETADKLVTILSEIFPEGTTKDEIIRDVCTKNEYVCLYESNQILREVKRKLKKQG